MPQFPPCARKSGKTLPDWLTAGLRRPLAFTLVPPAHTSGHFTLRPLTSISGEERRKTARPDSHVSKNCVFSGKKVWGFFFGFLGFFYSLKKTLTVKPGSAVHGRLFLVPGDTHSCNLGREGWLCPRPQGTQPCVQKPPKIFQDIPAQGGRHHRPGGEQGGDGEHLKSSKWLEAGHGCACL